jgi:hypothetical protein
MSNGFLTSLLSRSASPDFLPFDLRSSFSSCSVSRKNDASELFAGVTCSASGHQRAITVELPHRIQGTAIFRLQRIHETTCCIMGMSNL